MILWPSRAQWHRWTLPSKLTLVGLVVAVFAIPLAIYLSHGSATKTDIARSERRIIEHFDQRFVVEPLDLSRRYPLGYALFLTDGKTIYTPDNPSVSQLISVDWVHSKVQLSDLY